MFIKHSGVCPTRAIEEPNLQDLLADPTTHLIMESDGVRQEDLVYLLALARRRLHGVSDQEAPRL